MIVDKRDTKKQLLRDLLPFMLVAVIIGGAYAASVGPAGIEGLPWGNFTTGVAAPGIDTGQGLNEVYDMNQNVLTTSSPTFDDVTVSDELTIGGVTRTTWPDGAERLAGYTAYVGFNSTLSDYDNYFLCDGTADDVQINAAIAYGAAIEDVYSIYFEQGLYDCSADIVFLTGDHCLLYGVGAPKNYLSVTTSGGVLLQFENDANIRNSGTGYCRVTFSKMGFYFDGTYTDSAIDLFGGGAAGSGDIVNSYDCMYYFDQIVPNGNAGNPGSTPAGNVMNIGRVSGPPGQTYFWKRNIFVDQRAGAANASTLLCFVTEHLIFEGNSFFPYPAKTLNNPNFMFCNPVSAARFVQNIWYLQPGWTAAVSGQYYNMYMSSGANKNFFFYEDQFLDPAQIENAHFYTNSANMYVSGTFPHKVEGGAVPVDLSVGGGGTVHVDMTGRGYEVEGSAIIPNGEDSIAVTHGLVGTPTFIMATGTTADTDQLIITTIGGTTFNVTAVGAVGGDRTVYYRAKYNIVG